ncbi:conserved phage C-terminal domain-containing protein [Undibacterium flavidum]|uniref:Conserved phage C-terminal domain-containing protein n=1 Tax=Undibacterium flavidum TaxID=2762297 RepID=A0ABR6YCH1_9BURK|nr:conserved phage C-terminal domain-containing protein [Undibacterium flavidum]MBC3874257.1 conserved phage C-terminal domain-containing protein [Undibacterium flavidum]
MSGKPNATSVLNHLNEQTGKNYQAVKANLSLIEARLKEGFTVDQCKAVIDTKIKTWAHDEKMSAYLRPKTLFNATNFAQYAGELESNASEVQSWE